VVSGRVATGGGLVGEEALLPEAGVVARGSAGLVEEFVVEGAEVAGDEAATGEVE
jgi:hypothetical protein